MNQKKGPTKIEINRAPLRTDRIRTIGKSGFCFFPHRFLRDGFFASLHRHELLLYFFLVLAGDRNGISFYHYDRICDLLMLSPEDYLKARNHLIKKDLLAFDGSRFQILELPEKPILSDTAKCLTTSEDFENSDPATIRNLIQNAILHDEPDED